jgi:hypothetical protein
MAAVQDEYEILSQGCHAECCVKISEEQARKDVWVVFVGEMST